MNRKIAWFVCVVLAVLALVAVVVVGCGGETTTTVSSGTSTSGGTETTEGSTTTASVSSEPILFGFDQALSGMFSAYENITTAFGIQAIDDQNAKGGILGRKLEYIKGDNKSDVATSATIAQDLISKGAQILLVTGSAQIGGAAAKVAEPLGMLSFAMNCGMVEIGPTGVGPYIFTMSSSLGTHSGVCARFAAEKLGAKTSFLLEDTSQAFAQQLARAWEQQWPAAGGTIAGTATFANEDPSIAAQISKIKALSPQPDVIYLASYPPGGAAAVKQLRAAGLMMPILGADVYDGEGWYDSILDVKDLYYAANEDEFGTSPNPEVNAIVQTWRDNHPGTPLTAGGGLVAYSTLQIIFKAIEDSDGSTDGKVLTKTLESYKDVPSIVGPTTFGPKWHIQFAREMTIMQLNSGKHINMGYWKPATVIEGL